MGQVTVKIRDRAYRFSCNDGEEARLEALGAYVDGKVGELTAQFGRIGDERLMVMVALMMADELFDARGETPIRGPDQGPDQGPDHGPSAKPGGQGRAA